MVPVFKQIFEHAAVQRELGREVVVQVRLRQALTLGDHRGARAVEPALREYGFRTDQQMRFVGLADVCLASPQRRALFVGVGRPGARFVMLGFIRSAAISGRQPSRFKVR